MRARLHIAAGVVALGLLGGCNGPHEKAGEKADAAAGVAGGLLTKGPNEQLGAVQDRAEKDQKRAIEAQADAVEDRAKIVWTAADQRADALEQQAAAIRKDAKQTGKALDKQADAIRGKRC